MAGRKPESFTEQENAALRAAFRALRESQGWSTAEAGRQLEIGQQAASTILNRNGGFSRPTAERLAARLGYESANAIISEAGAAPNPMEVPQGWQMRDLAVTLARRMGYEEEAIRRVVVKFQETQFASRPARWWNDRIVAEATEMRALDTAPPPPVVTASPDTSRSPATKVEVSKRRRRAG